MGSPFQVESVSVLDRNEDSSSTFLVFGWSLRNGVTLSGQFCLRSRSERRLCAPSLVVGAKPSRWGHPFGSFGIFLRTRSERRLLPFIYPSLLRDGVTLWVVCVFSHSIVTKSSLDSWSVLIQDGVPLSGLDLTI